MIKGWFSVLAELGPLLGYYPEPDKSILVIDSQHLNRAKSYFAGIPFKIQTGARYLGGFLGDRAGAEAYVKEKIDDWILATKALTTIGWKEPQAAFSGFTRSLQCEWNYLQRIIPCCEALFEPLSDTIRYELIPALFGFDTLPQWVPHMAGLPVKWSGMGIRAPDEWGAIAYQTSKMSTQHLQDALLHRRGKFSLSQHKAMMEAGKKKRDTKVTKMCERSAELIVESFQLDEGMVRCLERGKQTGGWLSVIPRSRDGTNLCASEFRDGLAMRYRHTPVHLPSHCDGCGQRTHLDHALNCPMGEIPSFTIMK